MSKDFSRVSFGRFGKTFFLHAEEEKGNLTVSGIKELLPKIKPIPRLWFSSPNDNRLAIDRRGSEIGFAAARQAADLREKKEMRLVAAVEVVERFANTHRGQFR